MGRRARLLRRIGRVFSVLVAWYALLMAVFFGAQGTTRLLRAGPVEHVNAKEDQEKKQ